MEYSSNIVLNLLMPYRGKPYISAADVKKYKWAALLPEQPAALQPDILYVCRLSEALAIDREKAQCHFACICDRYLSDDDREDAELMRSIILVEENRGVQWLLNLIQDRFLELQRWESAMKDVLLRDGGYQQLMDVCEMCLKNPLFVVDSAYRLVACSKVYRSPDPMNIALYNKGYYEPEILQRFIDKGRFSEYFSNPGLVYGKPGVIGQFEAVCKWCRYDGEPLIQVVEVFSSSPMAADSPELFELMMEYVNICFLKEQRRNQLPAHSFSRFLLDMVYGDLTDPHKIGGCAGRTSIPVSGNFDAYRIVFRDNSKVLVGRFMQELSVYLRDSKIVARDFEVSVLNIYPKENIAELSSRSIGLILPLLRRSGALCGVSAGFGSLTGFRHACLQAAGAITFGQKMQNVPTGDSAGPEGVYYFARTCLYNLVYLGYSGETNLFESNPFVRCIDVLRRYDGEHNCNISELLYWYLILERSSTRTGEKLHMHRNTVVYHVAHIEELLGLDFGDYLTRQGMLLAFHYDRMNPGRAAAAAAPPPG